MSLKKYDPAQSFLGSKSRDSSTGVRFDRNRKNYHQNSDLGLNVGKYLQNSKRSQNGKFDNKGWVSKVLSFFGCSS